MKRLRRHLLSLNLAAAALFAHCVVAPRPELFYHQHRGGERDHVHADADEQWLTDFFAELEHHDHQHQHQNQPPYQDGLRTADASATGHWHQQQRFHRAIVPGPVAPTVSTPLHYRERAAPQLASRVVALDLHARGPPPRTLSA